jgi:hypothetical protein
VKAAHLRRDPRASIVVCEQSPSYRRVELRCRAQVVTAGVDDAVKRIASRYLGREAGAAYADRAGDDLLIRLEPGELRAWDFADEFSCPARREPGPVSRRSVSACTAARSGAHVQQFALAPVWRLASGCMLCRCLGSLRAAWRMGVTGGPAGVGAASGALALPGACAVRPVPPVMPGMRWPWSRWDHHGGAGGCSMAARRWTPNRVVQAAAVVFFALAALGFAGIITQIGPALAWLAGGLAAWALAALL